MNPLSIKKLAEVIKAQTLPDSAGTVSNISIDSRIFRPGSAFFAIKGANHDGHDFVNRAFENGAVCAVVQKKITLRTDKPVLFVDDTIGALGLLAQFARNNSDYKVIAITGSAGKTTTKNILYQVLSGRFRCFAAPKSYNNNIGVPLTVFDAPDDCEFIIAELGSNHPGEIDYLSRIIQPDIAVITTICPAHLEGFGSIEGIVKEKVSVGVGLRQGGQLFINGDKKELIDYSKKSRLDFTTFGTTENCDVYVKNIGLFGDRSTFVIDGVPVEFPLAGRANVENAAAVWAVCKYLGITAGQFSRSIADIKPVGMRLEVIEFGSVTVLNDCYNANPGSMENALETLALMAEQNRKRPVFIFGRMGELGAESRKLHAALGESIARYGIRVLLTTEGDSAVAARRASECADFPVSVGVFENVGELADNLHKFVKPDDIILVKASRSERFEAIVERLKTVFGRV